jgi:alkanesulfonate monooxygenase SsuD/methylene tetrahydromethanopterin reductase-like flavin-dependent oxidoreductase (luciferase family)
VVAGLEAAGIDHLAVGDHVSFLGGQGFDGLVHAAHLLALSDRLAVHVGVYLLALRHPLPVARQLADLSGLAPGRLVLGVGIGGEDRHEYEVCGVDPATRGVRTDEALGLLRRLATGEPVTSEGPCFPVREAWIDPGFDVPMLVGGRSDAAVRRAARHGDGWLGIWISPRRFGEVTGQVAELAAAEGRTTLPDQHGLQVWCGFGPTRERAVAPLARAMEALYAAPFTAFERYCPAGPPEEVAAFLRPYVDAGCHSFNLIPRAEDPADALAGVAEVRRLLQD